MTMKEQIKILGNKSDKIKLIMICTGRMLFAYGIYTKKNVIKGSNKKKKKIDEKKAQHFR